MSDKYDGIVKFDQKVVDKGLRKLAWSWRDDVRHLGLILGVPVGLFLLFLLAWALWEHLRNPPRWVWSLIFIASLAWPLHLFIKREHELLAENARLRSIVESNEREMADFRLNVSNLVWELGSDSEVGQKLRTLLDSMR